VVDIKGDPSIILFFFLMSALLIALITLIILFFEPKNKLKAYRKLQQLSKYFINSRVKLLLMKPSLRGQYQGNKFILKYDISNKYRGKKKLKGQYWYLISFDLYLPYKSEVKILVYKNLAGTVLFLKKFKTGYDELDNELHIFSNRPHKAINYFHNDVRRSSIIYFVDRSWAVGITPLIIGKEKLSIARTINEAELNQDFIKETLDKLATLKL
jgi:hypothetical protein